MTSLKSPANPLKPDFSIERSITGDTCGLDEVGRGPLAGPVVAACVYIPEEIRTLDFIPEIRDSKKLSEKKLTCLYELISTHCVYGIAEVSPQEIDEINILQASLKAMARAFDKMIPASSRRRSGPFSLKLEDPGLRRGDNEIWNAKHCEASEGLKSIHALVDGNRLPQLPCPATPVIKGDSKSTSIAAASILAKVTRDRLMARLAERHPHYGWERNVGYPTKEHMEAINRHGITQHHRKTFAPVRNFLEHGSTQAQLAS